jgi:hypothetical protein
MRECQLNGHFALRTVCDLPLDRRHAARSERGASARHNPPPLNKAVDCLVDDGRQGRMPVARDSNPGSIIGIWNKHPTYECDTGPFIASTFQMNSAGMSSEITSNSSYKAVSFPSSIPTPFDSGNPCHRLHAREGLHARLIVSGLSGMLDWNWNLSISWRSETRVFCSK